MQQLDQTAAAMHVCIENHDRFKGKYQRDYKNGKGHHRNRTGTASQRVSTNRTCGRKALNDKRCEREQMGNKTGKCLGDRGLSDQRGTESSLCWIVSEALGGSRVDSVT